MVLERILPDFGVRSKRGAGSEKAAQANEPCETGRIVLHMAGAA
jgi:hypothetical protein